MPIVADAAVALRLDLQKYRGDWRTAEQDAKTSGGRIAGALSPQNVGRAFTAAGAATGVFLTEASLVAGKFEDQLRTINTVAGLTDAELAALGDNIQQVARDSGKSTEDLTGGFYDLVSAGVPAEHAMDVLRNSATLATGALSTTGEAVDLVTSTLNAYGMDATESARLTDIFAKTVQDGKVNASQLAASIAQVAPIASNAGISIEEVAAGYAELTAKGVPAAQASTQMRAAISALLTPNETLNKLQQQTGINFAEMAREKGLAATLEEIRKATAANGDAFAELAGLSAEELPGALRSMQDELGLTNTQIEKLEGIAGKDGAAAAMNELQKQVGAGDSAYAKALGSVEALSFAVNTTGGEFENFQGAVDGFNEGIDGLATDQAAEKMKSPTEAAARLTQHFVTFMQDVGGPFAGTMAPVLMTLNNLGPALGGLLKPSRLLGGVFGALAGKLAAGAAGLVPAIGGAFATAGSAVGGFFTTAAGAVIAAWPLVLLALVVAAIALLLTNPEIREKALEIGGAIVKAIGDALGAIAGVVGAAVGAAVDAVAGAAEAIIGFIAAIPGRVAAWVGQLAGQAASAAGSVVGAIADGAGRVVGWILGIPGRIASWVGSLLGQAGQAAGGIVQAIAGMAGQVVGFILGLPGRVIQGWLNIAAGAARAAGEIVGAIARGAGQVVSTLLGIPGKAISGVVSGFANIGRQAVDSFLGFIRGIPEAVGNILGGIGDFVGGLIPSFQSGTMYAPEGLAYLHEGEIVVPPQMAEAVRGLLAGGAPGAGGRGPVTVQINNPTAEPAGTSAAREMELLNAMGVFG